MEEDEEKMDNGLLIDVGDRVKLTSKLWRVVEHIVYNTSNIPCSTSHICFSKI
jgi:hypothetical protein